MNSVSEEENKCQPLVTKECLLLFVTDYEPNVRSVRLKSGIGLVFAPNRALHSIDSDSTHCQTPGLLFRTDFETAKNDFLPLLAKQTFFPLYFSITQPNRKYELKVWKIGDYSVSVGWERERSEYLPLPQQ